MSESFQCLIFDLDDTLIDTYKLLIPPTIYKTAEAFVKLLQLQKEAIHDYMECWHELHHQYSGRVLFEKISRNCYIKHQHQILIKNLNLKNISDALFEIYLKPELPGDFKIKPEVALMLKNLSQSYHLYLVTQGNRESQQAKIDKLEITNYFKKIFLVNTHQQENKFHAFQTVLELEKCLPEKILSVGNRLSDEIAYAKKLGMKTCHIKKGEHQNEKPNHLLEIADWTIGSLSELSKECKL
jgi:FMN phosphatase YigB (HAD superfamily)